MVVWLYGCNLDYSKSSYLINYNPEKNATEGGEREKPIQEMLAHLKNKTFFPDIEFCQNLYSSKYSNQFHCTLNPYQTSSFIKTSICGEIWLGHIKCSVLQYIGYIFNTPENIFNAPKYIFNVPKNIFNAQKNIFNAPKYFQCPKNIFNAPKNMFNVPQRYCSILNILNLDKVTVPRLLMAHWG